MPGAPFKKGLSYFSHDTVLSDDPKIQFLEAEAGLIGYAIYNKILELAYRHEGYYFIADERSLKLFAKKLNIDYDELNNIIKVCINEDLFDQNMYKNHSILTSAGIQKRYLRGCDRRKQLELKDEYLLIDNNTIKENININNTDIIGINDSINGINPAKNKLNKIENKTDKNKTIINQSSQVVLDCLSDKSKEFILAFDEFIEMRKKIKKPMTDHAKELILKKLDDLSGGDENIKIAILNQSIMNCWQGVFELKQENSNGYKYKSNQQINQVIDNNFKCGDKCLGFRKHVESFAKNHKAETNWPYNDSSEDYSQAEAIHRKYSCQELIELQALFWQKFKADPDEWSSKRPTFCVFIKAIPNLISDQRHNRIGDGGDGVKKKKAWQV